MFKHILIATDGSEVAASAVKNGLELAMHLKAKVTAVNVTQPWGAIIPGEAVLGASPADYERAAANSAARALSPIAEQAAAKGLAYTGIHAVNQFPSDGILAVAKENGCDLIVMASHGRRGISRLLLGSETARVLTDSTIPVLVCR